MALPEVSSTAAAAAWACLRRVAVQCQFGSCSSAILLPAWPAPSWQCGSSPVWLVLKLHLRSVRLCRTMYGVPVTISDSQLFIPQPEWDALANEARQAPSFAMQLQSELPG